MDTDLTPAREVFIGIPYLAAVLCADGGCSAIYDGRKYDRCPNCNEPSALSIAKVLGAR